MFNFAIEREQNDNFSTIRTQAFATIEEARKAYEVADIEAIFDTIERTEARSTDGMTVSKHIVEIDEDGYSVADCFDPIEYEEYAR